MNTTRTLLLAATLIFSGAAFAEDTGAMTSATGKMATPMAEKAAMDHDKMAKPMADKAMMAHDKMMAAPMADKAKDAKAMEGGAMGQGK